MNSLTGLVDAVSDGVTRGEDGLGQSGFTGGHSRSGDGVGIRGNSITWVSSEAKDLAFSTDCWGSRLSSGDSGSVFSLSLSDFGCVLDLDGSYQIGDGSDGQVIGEDAEATGVGGVGNTDFFAFWVDVRVAADLVAESVTEVSGGLSGVRIAEAGLTELVLCVILGGGVGRIAVSDGVGGSCGDSGVGGADAGVRIVSTVVSTIELSLCGNSQHQKTGNLHRNNLMQNY